MFPRPINENETPQVLLLIVVHELTMARATNFVTAPEMEPYTEKVDVWSAGVADSDLARADLAF